MEKGPIRLLFNAEPFGYGPASAISNLALKLKDFAEIEYIGEGHTLDLQNYKKWDCSTWTETEIISFIREGNYTAVITALDKDFAHIAKKAGCFTIVYDTLTWYWSSIPKSFIEADLYLAQKFLGVEKVLDKNIFKNAVLVPVSVKSKKTPENFKTLLNFGGLQHPLWSLSESCLYASLIKNCFTIEPDNIITSKTVAEKVGADNVSHQESLSLISQSSVVYMTPGLGNIFDANCCNAKCVWLPPSNDSQGIQSLLLKEAGCRNILDWSDLGFPIDYSNQKRAIESIKEVVSVINPGHFIFL